ncbi:MAG: peptidoglycan-binding domain-containing protein [Patescibacteria group bacterium]
MKKLLLLGVLIFNLGIGASFVAAQTADVSATADVYADTDTCLKLTYDMKLGSTDASTKGEVSKLQSFLKSRNYSSAEPTGKFGDLTYVAVVIFQADNGIKPAEGVVGPQTRAKISEVSCNPKVKPLSFLQMLFGNIQTGPINLADLLARSKNIKPVPPIPAPTNQPSIEITASSGKVSSTSYIAVQKGDKVKFYGKPVNLSDSSYGKDGFTVAWKSSDPVFNEKCLKDRKFNGNAVWVINCKTTEVGKSEVYAEIYKDGKTYTSNKINVLVENRKNYKKSKIELDYVQSFDKLSNNVLSADQTATIYGSKLDTPNISLHLKGKTAQYKDTKLEMKNVQSNSIEFMVPKVDTGEYELWIEQSNDNRASNKLNVRVINTGVKPSTDFKFIFPAVNSKLIVGKTYDIAWTGNEPGAETYNFFLDCENPSCDAVLIGTAVAEKTPILSWKVSDNTKPRGDYFVSYNAVGKNVRSYLVAPRGPSFTISR